MMLRLAIRLFVRDWRSGELRTLMAALLIAVAGLTAIAVIVDRIERGMTRETNQILGADRVISSPRPVDPATLRHAEDLGLKRSESLRFRTMVLAGEQFQLSSVRAVDSGYPLAGQLRIADRPFARGRQITGRPKPGTVWVAPRLLYALNIQPGDNVEIGVKSFTVAGIIETEPGSLDLIDFTPNLIMALQDVPATQVIQPGSRIVYRYDFTGGERALKAFDQWSKTALNESERVLGSKQSAPAVESSLGRARNYLNLSGLLGLLLGGVAIAIAGNRFIRRHFDHAALLRCLGLRQNQVLSIYCLLLGMATAIGAILGIAAGYLTQHIAIRLMAGLLPAQIPPPSVLPAWLGLVTGFVVVAGFALPGLLRIRAVTPMRVLRRDLTPLPIGGWAVMAVSLTTLGLVMGWYTLDPQLVAIVLAGGVAAIALLLVFARLLLSLAQRLGRRASIATRFGLGHLTRHRDASLTQIVAFGVILSLMLIIYLVRGELIADWRQQLPAHAPNHFIVNLPPDETGAFAGFLAQHDIAAGEMYPMVRGRIVAINGRPLAEALGEDYEQRHNSVRRELNLTWSEKLPDANRVVRGEWTLDRSDNQISIEQEMADALRLRLGDTLTFNIGSFKVTAAIGSIRKVDWDSFKPNFYVIFPPGVLETFGATYISSFYLPPGSKRLLNGLLKRFPMVSVIELDRILSQVRAILDQASLAIEFVLGFVLAAGLAVLLATVYATLDEKIYEAGLLRTLGAANRFIRRCTVTEYGILALLAGGMAAITSECIAFALYRFVFHIEAQWHAWLWLAAPPLGMLLVVPAGLWGTRRVLKEAPYRILQQQQ
jgi:putative ABC transport system permease protein